MFRFNLTKLLRFLTLIVFIYILNLLTGLQYYLWLEKSFENEFDSSIRKINLNEINEENVENILGSATNLIENDFQIRNEHFCSIKTNETRLLILVKSAIENVDARQAIRLTWANPKNFENNSIRIAFVVGMSRKNLSIENEFQQYKDLIQIDKIDDYYHNSYKMLMMLRWISSYCSSKRNEFSFDHRRYVLFIDDDYYLNLKILRNYLNQLEYDSNLTFDQRRKFITGYVYKNSRPRRFYNDRWYISIDEYPYDRYPPYVTAGCFLMTTSNVRLFNLASKYVRLFRFDDIYMGLLAYSLAIQLIENNHLFSSYSSIWDRSSKKSQSICLHGYRGNELIQFWNDIYHTNLSLPMTTIS